MAPGGAVAKITGKEGLEFTGKAKTFDTEDAFVEAVEKGKIKKGEKTVAVLRYLGPKGGPGESVSRGVSFSTSRPGSGNEEVPGSHDTNVSPRSIPFPDFLACSFISVLRVILLFVVSDAFFCQAILPQPRRPIFSFLVERGRCGLNSVYR